jgi:hypothetical protein
MEQWETLVEKVSAEMAGFLATLPLGACVGVARAERKSRIGVVETTSAEAIDPFVRELIDQLIVPRLVDEFLRLYAPEISTQKASPSYGFRRGSGLNSGS